MSVTHNAANTSYASVDARQHHPMLSFDNAPDRQDFHTLVLFIFYLRQRAVQQALLTVISNRSYSATPVRTEEGEVEWADLIASALDDIDLSPDFGSHEGHVSPSQATGYNVVRLTKGYRALEKLVGYARKLPARILPPEAVPSGELMVRCANVIKAAS